MTPQEHQKRYREKHREAIASRRRQRDKRPDVAEYNRQRGLSRRQRHRQILEERLGGVCVECGTTKNLEFDHKHPGTKLFNITSRMNCQLNDTLLNEVDKCQLLCKPCHKRLTSKQKEIAWRLLCQLTPQELETLMND